MKPIISLFLLISFCSLTIHAQNLDSLYTIWQDTTQPDSTRILAYEDYIQTGFLHTQTDSAFLLAKEIVSFSTAKKNTKGEATGFQLLGQIMRRKGKYQKAIEYYQNALDLYQNTSDQKGICNVLYRLGMAHYHQRNFTNALDYLQRSYEVCNSIGEQKTMANALNNIGITYSDQGDYKQALNNYQQSLDIKKGIGDQESIANSLFNISNAYRNQGDYPQALDYLERCIDIEERIGKLNAMAGTLLNIGEIYFAQGDYPKALDNYQKSLDLSEKIDQPQNIADALHHIAVIYYSQKNLSQALNYYQRAMAIREKTDNQFGMANSFNSIGIIYSDQGDYPKALDYYQRSLSIHQKLGNQFGIANALNNIGVNYKNQGDYDKALEFYQQSLALNESFGSLGNTTISLINIGLTYSNKGNYPQAISFCTQGLELAKNIGALEAKKEAFQCLYDTYKAKGQSREALRYLENLRIVEDSLNNQETNKKLGQMEFGKIMLQDSIDKAEELRLLTNSFEAKVRKEKNIRNGISIGLILLILIALGLYNSLRFVRKSRSIIEKEKERSESLLLNILPQEVATELKEFGEVQAKGFDNVTVIFTDFVGFTRTTEKLSAQELVAELNACFKKFDEIIQKYNIEKIKTIGDAYMAAGGFRTVGSKYVSDVVSAGLEMQQFVMTHNQQRQAQTLPTFDMRVGIHTGPVIAGIVGVKKFQYDIWGDTVNIASRMESTGETGKINISKTTYEAIKDDPAFTFKSRGDISIKGKGMIETYFVAWKSEKL